jgi:hypothetical protein
MQSKDVNYLKYLKYKNKYLNLLSQTGGSDRRSVRPTASPVPTTPPIYPDYFLSIAPIETNSINLISITYNRKWRKKYDNTDYIIYHFTNKIFNSIQFCNLELYLNDLYTILSQNTDQYPHITQLFIKMFSFSNKNIYNLFNFIALFENIKFLNIDAVNFDNIIVPKILDIIRTNKSKNKLQFLKSIRFDFVKNQIDLKTQKAMVKEFKAIDIDLTYDERQKR